MNQRKTDFTYQTLSNNNLKPLSMESNSEELLSRYNNLSNKNLTSNFKGRQGSKFLTLNYPHSSKMLPTVKSKHSNNRLNSNNLSRGGSFVSATPRNPYTDVFNEFKNVLKNGITNPIYFLDKSVLNVDIEQQYDRYFLDKLLKINNFCENIETLEISTATLKNTNKNSIHENLKSETSPETEDTSKSVIVHSSERRLGVYDGLFQSMKQNLNDIIHICTILKDNNPSPFKRGKTDGNINASTSTNSNFSSEGPNYHKTHSDQAINVNLNLNVGGININKIKNNIDNRSTSGKISKKISQRNPSSNFNSEITERDELISSEDESVLSVGEEISEDYNVSIPLSKISNVNLSRNKLTTEKYDIKRQATKKDFLLYSNFKDKTLPKTNEDKPKILSKQTLSKSFEDTFISSDEINK